VWESTLNGQQLHFHLAGINNQNFIMRDEETGSWWQQVTGEAILGPLKGSRLKAVSHDELTFDTWKRENPKGRVLKQDQKAADAGRYEPADWEDRMQKVPVATSAKADNSLEPRTLIAGVKLNGTAKAYPIFLLQKQRAIVDQVGGRPIIVVIGADNRSVRVFERTLNGAPIELFVKPDISDFRMTDAATGSEWDFTGRAVSGPLTGNRLTKIDLLLDYWFDWHGYNPSTSVYRLGETESF
jgi:hypothetical protein